MVDHPKEHYDDSSRNGAIYQLWEWDDAPRSTLLSSQERENKSRGPRPRAAGTSGPVLREKAAKMSVKKIHYC